jgi:hypothetical protein
VHGGVRSFAAHQEEIFGFKASCISALILSSRPWFSWACSSLTRSINSPASCSNFCLSMIFSENRYALCAYAALQVRIKR